MSVLLMCLLIPAIAFIVIVLTLIVLAIVDRLHEEEEDNE